MNYSYVYMLLKRLGRKNWWMNKWVMFNSIGLQLIFWKSTQSKWGFMNYYTFLIIVLEFDFNTFMLTYLSTLVPP